MIISLKKFGSTLISRGSGKEAFLAFQPTLREINKDEKIIIDFQDVDVLAPSWADEFITPILQEYKEKVSFANQKKNASVQATLKLLENIKAS